MVKDKIQTSQLVLRLQKHAFGELQLTDAQRDSIKFLLNKTLSNAPTEVSGEGGGAIEFGHSYSLPPEVTKEEWLTLHGFVAK